MRATVMYAAGDVRVEDRPDPVIEQPTDAVVRVVRSCVCGSDLHYFHKLERTESGRTTGHEFIGIVEAVGAAVTAVRPGDFVISPFAFADNTCALCREGVHTACPNGGFFAGAQAEYVRVPQADGTLVIAPGITESTDEALLKSLLALSDVYLTGYHGAAMGRVGPGKIVTVIGDGAVGLSAVLAARQLGAEQIILMGRHASRTDLGRDFGATHVVAARGEEGIAEVRELTGGFGSHVLVEAVGHLSAYEQCLGVIRPGGVISRVGVPQYDDVNSGPGPLFGSNVTLTGGVAPVRAYLEPALAQVLAGTVEPGRVFDSVLPLEQAAQAYADMDERRSIKVMLRP